MLSYRFVFLYSRINSLATIAIYCVLENIVYNSKY